MPCNSHAKERSQPGINQSQPDSKLLVSKDFNKSGEISFGTLLHIFPTSAAHCLSGVTLLIHCLSGVTLLIYIGYLHNHSVL